MTQPRTPEEKALEQRAYLTWLDDLKPIRTMLVAFGLFVFFMWLVGTQLRPHHPSGMLYGSTATDVALAVGLITFTAPLCVRFFSRPAALREAVMWGGLTRYQAAKYGVLIGVFMFLVCIPAAGNASILAVPGTAVLVIVFAPAGALVSTILFQGWLQTRLAGSVGSTLAVFVTAALCTTASVRGRTGIEIACFGIANVLIATLRSMTGSLLACIVAETICGALITAAGAFFSLRAHTLP